MSWKFRLNHNVQMRVGAVVELKQNESVLLGDNKAEGSPTRTDEQLFLGLVFRAEVCY